MTTLCGWLVRAKKSPWNTSGFGSTLNEAGTRYLDVATPPQLCIYIASVVSLAILWLHTVTKAKPDDVLMEMFQRDILKETLV